MSSLAVVLAAVAFGGEPSDPESRPSITGTVVGTDAQPLAGATVFISTAAPRDGIGVL